MAKKDVKLRLDTETWRKLRAEAARRNRPMSHLLLEQLADYLAAVPAPTQAAEANAAADIEAPAAA